LLTWELIARLALGAEVEAARSVLALELGALGLREAGRTVAGELERARDRHVGADAGERLQDLVLRLVEAVAERADGDDEADADAEPERGEEGAALPAPELRDHVSQVEHGASIRRASKSGRRAA
jgi:hypothetical protein